MIKIITLLVVVINKSSESQKFYMKIKADYEMS